MNEPTDPRRLPTTPPLGFWIPPKPDDEIEIFPYRRATDAEPDDGPELEEMLAALDNVAVVIWFCPARKQHTIPAGEPTVSWTDGIAHCLAGDCDITSADTRLAANRWDIEEAPVLASDGIPADVLARMRRDYIRDVCIKPIALQQLRHMYAPRPGDPGE